LESKVLRILLSPILVREAKEECIGIVILLEDVTEAKVLERSKDEFFSIASHELRTPLTAIRGNTSMVLEYYADALSDPALKEMISDVHESSINLINIVNDFLNVSRFEQKRIKFNIKPFDIGSLIELSLKEYEVTGSRQKLHLLFEEPKTPLPQVLADPDRVREILVNLIGNSLKFTEEGGVTVRTALAGNMLEISVEDTGRGISVPNQSLLFHKFQQAGSSLFTRDTTRGTGLGLYISKMMVEGMGGTIRLVKSEEGKGSTFAFTLPLATK